MGIGSPQPSVLHLTTIFRQISAGEIRIPAFQREFVWKEKQVLELLESVRCGYPIGSVLLWYVENPILKISSAQASSFPDVPDRYPTQYVLDGMQRLSSLYGVFHDVNDARFKVWFDLVDSQFLHEEDIDLLSNKNVVPLTALFSPRALLNHQARLAEAPNADELIGRLVDLQGAFQEYMIPVVQIRGEEIEPIVTIFEKINSTGTSLNRVDFMRAITWAHEFDLSRELDLVRDEFEDTKFQLTDETIVKCIGLILGIDPTSDALLQLRTMRPSRLLNAFDQFKAGFPKVIEFARSELSIESSDFIPYEGQLLVMFRAVATDEMADATERRLLKSWFWATSFNESLRGKPDHYVARAINDWRALVGGKVRGLEPRLKLSPRDFIERRIIKGKALSTAFVGMFAANHARSFDDGEVMDPTQYMTVSNTGNFKAVLHGAALVAAGIDAGPSSKVFANLILQLPTWYVGYTGTESVEAIKYAAQAGRFDILKSQFIDEQAVYALKNGDLEFFIESRAITMFEAAERLVGEGTL